MHGQANCNELENNTKKKKPKNKNKFLLRAPTVSNTFSAMENKLSYFVHQNNYV